MLSVVIPTKNSRHLLETFLPKNLDELKQMSEVDGDLEVIVVDGGSNDNTDAFIGSLSNPLIQYHRHPNPRGYGEHCNYGVMRAKFDMVMILTTDVSISKEMVSSCLVRLNQSNKIFSVSPPILRVKENFLNESMTVGNYKRAEIRLKFGFVERDPGCRCKLLWPCGAVFFAKRDLFLDLGGFSPEFSPGYCEDVDLGIRALIAGYECWYEPADPAQHWHNSTMQNQENVRYLLSRNHFLLNLKFLPTHLIPLFIFRRFYKLIRNPKREEFRAIVDALRLSRRPTFKRLRFSSRDALNNALAAFARR